MAITLEEMRAKNRGVKRPTEEFEVEEGYTLTIGGVASFGAMRSRAREVEDLKTMLAGVPLKDGDGNPVPVDDETLQMALMVACSIREPAGLTVKDVLEMSVAYPFAFGGLFERVMALNVDAVTAATDEAERKLALYPTTPPASE